METLIEHVSDEASNENRRKIQMAADVIKGGGLVAFPTETVYGLGGDALDPQAARNIYEAKGRPSDNPLIVHIADMHSLDRVVQDIPEQARKLAESFWPGPLTMIFHKSDAVPQETTGGLSTVAVRMPDHPIALALIRESGGYIAAPSANTSGKPSPTCAEHVWEDLQGRIPLIIDGGKVEVGIESAIIDFTEKVPAILRPGAVTREMIEAMIGKLRPYGEQDGKDADIHPKAPGMKYKHYAPKAELVLVKGQPEQVKTAIRRMAAQQEAAGKRAGILVAEEINAPRLYALLREMDASGADVIYCEYLSGEGLTEAVRNRLLKAAGYHVIELKE